MNTITLHKFDLSNIKKDSHILIVGKPCSGKKVLVQNILDKISNNVDAGLLFSSSEKILPQLKNNDIFKNDTYYKYDSEILSKFLSENSVFLDRKNKSLCVIFDRCRLDWNDQTLSELFQNGWQYRTYVIIIEDSLPHYEPEIRTSLDYAFIFNENVISIQKKIYEQYFYIDTFPYFTSFKNVFNQCTKEPYNCIVVDNHQSISLIGKQVYYWNLNDVVNTDKIIIDNKLPTIDEIGPNKQNNVDDVDDDVSETKSVHSFKLSDTDNRMWREVTNTGVMRRVGINTDNDMMWGMIANQDKVIKNNDNNMLWDLIANQVNMVRTNDNNNDDNDIKLNDLKSVDSNKKTIDVDQKSIISSLDEIFEDKVNMKKIENDNEIEIQIKIKMNPKWKKSTKPKIVIQL